MLAHCLRRWPNFIPALIPWFNVSCLRGTYGIGARQGLIPVMGICLGLIYIIYAPDRQVGMGVLAHIVTLR